MISTSASTATRGLVLRGGLILGLGRVDILIKWDLDTIDFYYTSVLRHLEFLATEAYAKKPEDFNKDGSLTRYSLATGAYKMALNSILYELNATVESYLLHFASLALPEEQQLFPEAVRKSRKSLIAAVEGYYDISLENLPGWHVLDKLKEEVNALKHRGGMLIPDYSLGIPLLKHVMNDEDKCKAYLAAVRDFLFALWQVVLRQQDSKNKSE